MRTLSSLLAAGLAATSCLVVSAGHADASIGNPVLGCAVYPAHTQPTYRQFCSPDEPASSYEVDFQVLQSGSTSYAWTVPSGSHIRSGCTSTTSICALTSTSPAEITVSVTLSPSGTTASATAELDYCGQYLC